MNETIADIIAEKREMADALESATSRDRTAEQQETIDDLRTDADRVEAAFERDRTSRRSIKIPIEVVPELVGNAAAVREALELLNQLFDSCVLGTHSEMTADEMDKVDELYFKTKAALAAPPRQCDIGTAEEQAGRFAKVCTANSKDGVRGLCSEKCPFSRDYQSECALAWAQMPYEAKEGGAK